MGQQRIPTAHELYFGHTDPAHLDELEKVFFRRVRLRNGTFKITSRHRLDDLNAFALPYLPATRPLDIMDVAASSGVSTLEWVKFLEGAGVQCQMTAGDAVVEAYLVTVGKHLRMLVDRSGHPLQYEVAGAGITATLRKRDWFKHFLPAMLLRAVCLALGPTLADPVRAAGGKRWGMHWRPLKLLSPSIDNSLDVVEDDILESGAYVRCFDVVRAANILNLGYFDTATLTIMLANLCERLRDGGRLIVCRSKPDRINHATVFGLDSERRLQVLARLNDGSEVEAIALSLPPAGVSVPIRSAG